ncbi:MAG: hypothetical protein KGI80_03215 [Verrucomicrobiota bacterium]|nr:hypothetical protein [Verrucomicrobiota bacterium]
MNINFNPFSQQNLNSHGENRGIAERSSPFFPHLIGQVSVTNGDIVPNNSRVVSPSQPGFEQFWGESQLLNRVAALAVVALTPPATVRDDGVESLGALQRRAIMRANSRIQGGLRMPVPLRPSVLARTPESTPQSKRSEAPSSGFSDVSDRSDLFEWDPRSLIDIEQIAALRIASTSQLSSTPEGNASRQRKREVSSNESTPQRVRRRME